MRLAKVGEARFRSWIATQAVTQPPVGQQHDFDLEHHGDPENGEDKPQQASIRRPIGRIACA
jgi:hypothetical protein